MTSFLLILYVMGQNTTETSRVWIRCFCCRKLFRKKYYRYILGIKMSLYLSIFLRVLLCLHHLLHHHVGDESAVQEEADETGGVPTYVLSQRQMVNALEGKDAPLMHETPLSCAFLSPLLSFPLSSLLSPLLSSLLSSRLLSSLLSPLSSPVFSPLLSSPLLSSSVMSCPLLSSHLSCALYSRLLSCPLLSCPVLSWSVLLSSPLSSSPNVSSLLQSTSRISSGTMQLGGRGR